MMHTRRLCTRTLLAALVVVVAVVWPTRATAQPMGHGWSLRRIFSWRIHEGPQLRLGGDSGAQKVVSQDDSRDGLRWTSRGFAALGDSYAAGIGTRVEGKEDKCRHGLGAYPALMHADLDQISDGDGARNTTFQWLTCTGATTDDVLGTSAGGSGSQLDALEAGPAALLDFATLSLGGNDLGFFDVINACVFRFYGWYAGTCEAALAAAEARMADDNDTFVERVVVILLQILERVRWETRPGFRIVVTGYARFFSADTADCDTCSMSVWWSGPHNRSSVPPAEPGNGTDSTLLTRALRRRLNGLVAGTNAKLAAAVATVNARFARTGGDRVLFVSYDAAFDGHRFCEPGVLEPDYQREATWFFLVGGPDNNQTVAQRGDGQLLAPQNSMWYVPTYYGKTFHPRSNGHRAIRDAIYNAWEENGL